MGGNDISPMTDPISSLLTYIKIRYFSLDYFARSCRPRSDFLAVIILKVPTMCGIGFDFPKKRQGKNISRRIFSTPANVFTISYIDL